MKGGKIAGTLAVALGLTAAGAGSARAYVQYQVMDDNGNPTGVYFHWGQSCVPVTAYPDQFRDMTPAQVGVAATAAAGAWSRTQVACTFMDVEVDVSSDPTHPAGSDPYNVLVFKDPWCDPAHPGQCEPSALAITSVWANKKTGVIHDGDIEVNADPSLSVWADLDIDPELWKNDLQNALTHEMGHLIGLDHNCYSPTTAKNSRPMIDDQGNAVPDCADAPDDVQAATMFNSAKPGDMTKRTLSPDDLQAVCDIYPVAADPMLCPTPPPPPTDTPTGGCAYGGGARATAGGALSVALAAAAVLFARRRRRRRRRATGRAG